MLVSRNSIMGTPSTSQIRPLFHPSIHCPGPFHFSTFASTNLPTFLLKYTGRQIYTTNLPHTIHPSEMKLTLRLLMSYIYMEGLILIFLDHTQRRSTVGRTPLDEWSARRKDLYLTTHDTGKRTNIHALGGIRTHDLSRWAACGYIYIYAAPILDVSRSHTTTQHSL